MEPLESIDHQSAGHAAENLIVDGTVRVRVIPVKARALPSGGRDPHFVLERFAGMNVHEHIVAVSPRRHAHAVIVELRGVVWPRVAKGDAYGIAMLYAQERRQISAVVEKAGEWMRAEPHRTSGCSERCLQHAIAAANLLW